MRIKIIAIILYILIIGVNCQTERLKQNSDICSSKTLQKEKMYSIMQEDYLWYNYLPTDIDVTRYESMQELLEALKYKKYDKWSYIVSAKEFSSYFEEGVYIGVGFSLSAIEDNGEIKVFVRYVYKDSPAYKANIKRGDEILKINGKSIEEVYKNGLWSIIFGEDKEGVKVRLEIKKEDNQIKNIELSKEIIKIITIYPKKIVKEDNKNIGYIHFLTFIEPSKRELIDTFREFKENGVDELILDLRYNGGGRLDVALLLGSLIGGVQVEGEVFQYLRYNDKNSKYNYTYRFEPKSELDLGLKRVYILTTQATCSASETIINGLRPFMEVITIGEKSCGKPVGMNEYSICEYSFNPITFKVYNANEEGDYFNGLAPSCYIEDDLSFTLADTTEPLLSEALYYIKNNRCSDKERKREEKSKIKSEEIYKGFKNEIKAF